jgi:hypothetical protein
MAGLPPSTAAGPTAAVAAAAAAAAAVPNAPDGAADEKRTIGELRRYAARLKGNAATVVNADKSSDVKICSCGHSNGKYCRLCGSCGLPLRKMSEIRQLRHSSRRRGGEGRGGGGHCRRSHHHVRR